MSPEDILRTLLEGFDVEIKETSETKFSCNCSKERVEKALISIGKEEIRDMIQDGEPIEVKCHFCNTGYMFSVEDLEGIYKKANK